MMQTDGAESGIRDDLLHDQVSIFPVPPLEYFTSHFSDDVLALNYPSVEHGVKGSDSKCGRFPPPPPVPVDESFDSFGIPITRTDHVLRDLEQQGITPLGAEVINKKVLLRRLLWSAVAKFIELLDFAIKSPNSEQRTTVFEDLQTIFINFHHTVNQYRQPQATESFVELLNFQRNRNLKQASELLDNVEQALTVLTAISDSTKENTEGSSAFLERNELAQEFLTDLYGEIQHIRTDLTALQGPKENGFTHS